MSELLNLAEEILDDAAFESTESFKITNDNLADWAMDCIRENQSEINRFEMVVKEKVRQLQEKLEQFKDQKQRNISYFEGMLREYFETLSIKPTNAGNKIYNLPSGKISLTKQKPEFIRDDEKLISWAEQHNKSEIVKIKKTFDWAELKKSIKVSGNGVVDENGEIVDGVEVKEREPKFEVKV